MNSQSSSRHQSFYIVSVYFQGLVVLIHGFHMTAVFKMIHTWTHAEGTKAKNKKRGECSNYRGMDLTHMQTYQHVNDSDEFMIIRVQPILWISILRLNVSITTSGPMMQTVSSELQKQNPPLWRICCKEKMHRREGLEQGSRLPACLHTCFIHAVFRKSAVKI